MSPKLVSWAELVGREAKVIRGPLKDFVGIVQENRGGYIVLSYLDKHRQPRTVNVAQEYVEPPVQSEEELVKEGPQ